MKVNLIIKNNLFMPYSTEDVDKIDSLDKTAIYTAEVGKGSERTIRQNSALHRYFSLVSIELNKRGIRLDPDGLNLEWDTAKVKENIWKEFQRVVLGKNSTRLLTTTELTEIYDYVNQFLGERFSFNVCFPNKEQLENKE